MSPARRSASFARLRLGLADPQQPQEPAPVELGRDADGGDPAHQQLDEHAPGAGIQVGEHGPRSINKLKTSVSRACARRAVLLALAVSVRAVPASSPGRVKRLTPSGRPLRYGVVAD